MTLGHAQSRDSATPVLPAADGSAATSQTWNWNDLLAWSEEQGPAIRLARLKEHVASSNLQLVEADIGARLIGSAGVSRVKEPITDTLNRSYTRAYGQAGLRWSFLGAQEGRRRNVVEARADKLGSIAQTQLLQAQAVTEIGRLYVRYLRSQQREQLTQAYLHKASLEQSRLQQRIAGGNMLRAEGMELTSYFDAAKDRTARERELQAAALRQLGFLSGRSLRAQSVPALALGAQCLAPATLQDALDSHPSLEAARHAMQSAQEQAQYTKYGGVEGGVQLSQSLSKDLNGSGGHATAVAVDVSIPLQWRAHNEALSSKLQGQYQAAAEQLAQTQQKMQLEQQSALEQVVLRDSEAKSIQKRYAAAVENWRVVRLRAPALEDDAVTSSIKARHELYEMGLQLINSAESQDLAAMDMLYYTRNCMLQQRSDDPARQLFAGGAALSSSQPSAQGAKHPNTAAGESSKSPSSAAPNAAPLGMGWYSWQGQQWVQNPAKLEQLPAGTQRLLMSFTASQLQGLTQNAQARQGLEQLVQKAQQRGVRLELLLGEPSWVLPQGRPHLMQLLAQVQTLPFAMVHLDLERNQLPAGQQAGWTRQALDTLAQASAQSRIPLSLTTHHRELRQPGFLEGLKKAGVKEVIPMIYSANARRIVNVVRELPEIPAGLDLAVAQSIEKNLPAEESKFRSGRRQSLVHWQGIARSLQSIPAFKGIVVQSWEDYIEAQP